MASFFIQEMFSQSIPHAELSSLCFLQTTKTLTSADSISPSIFKAVPELSMRGKALTRPLREGLQKIEILMGKENLINWMGS
jgi:hypothetical protein